ncbi:HAD-IA family hydrolase [Massilia sp. Root335]|uniref:HAD-IA family hydrolase n=1 Tax=Massilia sp. Root335 TaxID=1736517 RepID=UPI0006F8162A|nr:HAD-IA family hydrolase [Massilia sp. Root335]KQV36905.1 hypothetical protein ASC93_22030 [Massilia sp. Root335]
MIKAILWDNDGVLCDTERLFFEANRRVPGPHDVALTREQYLAWYLDDNHGAWHVLRGRGYDEARIAQVRAARDAYLQALDKLRLDPDECIAVEDSPRGLAAARAAGLRCIVLRSELLADYAFTGAFRAVDSHRELENELCTLLDSD